MPSPSLTTEPIELSEQPSMNRFRNLFQSRPEYEPLRNSEQGEHGEDEYTSSEPEAVTAETPFSWIAYSVFLLLGVAMLWAWNMFLAAAPYFQHRFQNDPWIYNHFQPAEVSVSTLTSLVGILALSARQKHASYPKRISASLLLNMVVFTALAFSTLVETSARKYFGFLMAAIFGASLSTALIQNGVFSFAAGFGRGEYIRAVMIGNAVAGVLPPLAQIISVASISDGASHDADDPGESPKAAFIYFVLAAVISCITLFAFFYLLRSGSRSYRRDMTAKPAMGTSSAGGDSPTSQTLDEGSTDGRKSVPLTTLMRKLPFLSLAIVICFAVTMVFPVFTASIPSVSGMNLAIFIPLSFLLWNTGDLVGRLSTMSSRISLTHYPFALFCLAMARLVFIPLYFLCNIKGRGAIVNSDVFYLVIVQFLFGLSNGYLGSSCMMGAADWVAPEEREAAGGYMGLMLVVGLTVGSLLSFLLGDI